MPTLEKRRLGRMKKGELPINGSYAWVVYERKRLLGRRGRNSIVYGPRYTNGQPNQVLADAESLKKPRETIVYKYGGIIDITDNGVTLSGRPEDVGIPVEPMSDDLHNQKIQKAGRVLQKIAGRNMNVATRTLTTI